MGTMRRGSSLAEAFPSLAAEADGWDPSEVPYGSAKVLPWVCEKGHRWNATPNSRSHSGGSLCGYCSNRLIWPGDNDLATLRPDLAAEADGWDPTQVGIGSHDIRVWRCSLGHTWNAQVKSRATGDHRCRYCSNQAAWPGFNDLATTHPALAAEADGWNPTNVIAGSGKILAWECAKGHRWNAALNSRVAGNSCAVCANRQVLEGYNDLASQFPNIAAQADGWDPRTVVFGSHKKMAWRCNLGHPFKQTVLHRTARGQACPYCANRKVLAGFNDLATHYPELAAEADGWDPTTEIVNSHHVREWRCVMGHTWRAQINSRCQGRGCRACARHGFNTGKAAWLYLLRQDSWGMHQIGIANSPESRLAVHRASGWEVIDIMGPMLGATAYDLEQSVLRALDAEGVARGDTTVAGRFSGYTEAWRIDDRPVASLADLLDTISS